MRPVLFELGGMSFETDGVLYFLAVVLAGLYASRVALRRRWAREDVFPGVVLTATGALAGAWLHGWILARTIDPGGEVGLSFFGGLVLGALVMIDIRWRGYPVGEVMDELAPVAPVVYLIFRLGCLMNGDDYGRPTDLPWGMTFPEGSPPTGVPVHPTQIYEMGLMVPLFAWVWWRRGAGMKPGALAFELAAGMAIERFVVEFWRIGAPGPAGFTVAQWFSLALLAIAIGGRAAVSREDGGGKPGPVTPSIRSSSTD